MRSSKYPVATATGVTLPKEYESLDAYAEALCQAYRDYGYLAQMHIVDFFVANHWKQLPLEWQEYFDSDNFEIKSLIEMASSAAVSADCPESLRTYVRQMFALQFPRTKVEVGSSKDAGGHRQQQIPKYFLGGMSLKKQAEVIELSQLVNRVAVDTGCRRIVDVGAGQGYLTRVLAYANGGSNAELLAIDHDWKQVRGAERYQESTLKRLKGPRARSDGFEWDDSLVGRIKHDVQAVDMQTTGALADLCRKDLGDGRFMLCGLHACGDLSSAVLKTFAESDAAAVVLVPCCYNHITENAEHTGGCIEAPLNQSAPGAQPGFPLSTRFSGMSLGTNSLKAACQAAPRWEHDAEGTMGSFQRNFFRALLHYLMVADGGLSTDAKFPVVGKITATDLQQARDEASGELADVFSEEETDFAVYARAALAKLRYPWVPTVARCAACHHEMRHGLRQMAAVWALRSMVGALIESILVVDRAAYLGERCGADGTVDAFALFDPVTSPRSIVLVARRK
ncbi:hypothetical protein LPJ56_000426 [Coemansia sp. RSA 2599]|nr:hypothetical protein LPJ75_000082 [Coemansia sp. RSA 2598]KAJ1829327.1 hypothetical protein LPJ56_000426 [Coemansia sp. RSA 2599]